MTQSLDQALAGFSPGLPFVVALSGGADSTALLCACAERWPGQVRAVHVHHGLQAAADGFESHCRQLCAQLHVPLAVCHVDARPAPGQSPEDAARRARYAALAEAAQDHWPDAKGIVLAQHADDQVETLLIALSRGAGLPGLASMPAHWARAGWQWHRPLLQVAGADVRQWLRDRGQAWVEDPTNSDEQFTRNRIRAQVLPALAQALPAFRDTFARSAAHAAQAQALLDELAAEVLEQVGLPPAIAALRALSPARQALVLRHWLKSQHQVTPSTAQLQELQAQLADCTTRGHRLHLKVGGGFVRREGDVLNWQPV
ncbi:tRNA lysidine(34) synthetase TilS [Limnohabitans radicicola]|uniref:tRNA(Ile)-lysidine synthase n=1 Tax=Limnohabitans radicicola TaxID=2771427 RepID=A0A927IM47_9BURK|nr:tRNA lysidine(34) synthetase TilS [Limnohabitans radicicola]MBD8050632.1 tRNA lysidine(34) synthetase TilS [Limnohabitans radicicola]